MIFLYRAALHAGPQLAWHVATPWVEGPLVDLGEALTAVAGSDGRPLDLTQWDPDRYARGDTSGWAAMTLALLSADAIPSALVLPPNVNALRVLARFGVLIAAERRGVVLELGDTAVGFSSAVRGAPTKATLPGFDWKRCDDLLTDEGELEDRLTRLRVVADLEDPARHPPVPDEESRRYRWIDNLGAATSLSASEARWFNGDADQVVYEAIDNVHRWAQAPAAVASCAVTRGGGVASHNRFHVVVGDSGRGIAASVTARRERQGLPPWQDDPKVRALVSSGGWTPVEAMLQLLVSEARNARFAEPAGQGQGLHAIGVLASQWRGSFLLITADGDECTWISQSGRHGNRSIGHCTAPTLRGTLVHVTLDASSSATNKHEEEQVALASA